MSKAMAFERHTNEAGVKEIHIFITRPIDARVLILRADGTYEEKEAAVQHWFGYYDVAESFKLTPEMLRDEANQPVFEPAFKSWWATVETRGLDKKK